jgi:hypothetical protein
VAGYAGLVLGERLEPVQVAGLAGVCAGLLALAEVGRGPSAGAPWPWVAALRETSVLVAALLAAGIVALKVPR